jgi:hypothetical protein
MRVLVRELVGSAAWKALAELVLEPLDLDGGRLLEVG